MECVPELLAHLVHMALAVVIFEAVLEYEFEGTHVYLGRRPYLTTHGIEVHRILDHIVIVRRSVFIWIDRSAKRSHTSASRSDQVPQNV